MVTQEVKIPVAVSCLPSDRPAKPTFTDTPEALKAAPDFATRYQLLAANYLDHQAWEALTDKLLDACAKAAAPPMPK